MNYSLKTLKINELINNNDNNNNNNNNNNKERFSVTFTSNGKGECVPRDQVSQLLVVYCSLTPLIN